MIFMQYDQCKFERAYEFISQPPLRWRHNGRDSVSNHKPQDCFLNRLFRHRSTKISKLRVTGLCAGNSPEAGEFPAQMASNAENVSIWWRHHGSSVIILKSKIYKNFFSVVSLAKILYWLHIWLSRQWRRSALNPYSMIKLNSCSTFCMYSRGFHWLCFFLYLSRSISNE